MLGLCVQIFDNGAMKCVVATTNPVRLTYLQSLLDGADIPFLVFDQHMAALEGGIGAFPRRLMVPDERLLAARTLLSDCNELYDD